MTVVTILSNKSVSNDVKDNKMLLRPPYGENTPNFLANPIILENNVSQRGIRVGDC